jgi:hypothetical protein
MYIFLTCLCLLDGINVKHQFPYSKTLWRQFTDTFDVYLMILREVQKRIAEVLGHAEPHWREKNSCPSCQYKVVIFFLLVPYYTA